MFALNKTADMTYDVAALLCWSIAEVASGITCACIPTLRPLAGRYLSSALGTYQNRQSSRGYENYGSGAADRKKRQSHQVTASDNTLVDGDDQNYELSPTKPSPIGIRSTSERQVS